MTELSEEDWETLGLREVDCGCCFLIDKVALLNLREASESNHMHKIKWYGRACRAEEANNWLEYELEERVQDIQKLSERAANDVTELQDQVESLWERYKKAQVELERLQSELAKQAELKRHDEFEQQIYMALGDSSNRLLAAKNNLMREKISDTLRGLESINDGGWTDFVAGIFDHIENELREILAVENKDVKGHHEDQV